MVFYAAYGSNLAEERFLCYVRGGRPCGGKTDLKGCRDKTLPTANAIHELPFKLFIASRSKSWDGHGVAFVGTRPRVDEACAVRLWLLTERQLADVVAQENGLPPGNVQLSEHMLSRDGHYDLRLAGKYGRIIRRGVVDGRPVLTCTTADTSLQRRPRAPASGYLRWMAQGLREMGWRDERIADYLFEVRGVRRLTPTRDSLSDLISQPPCGREPQVEDEGWEPGHQTHGR